MSRLNDNCCDQKFTHIYIEESALNYPETKKILETFPHAEQIIISHYKDVFCRRKQNFHKQKEEQQLILAVKHNHLIYPGAPVCQNFDHSYFYYTSSIMNCMYDCEYCYLQGMYPSANLVIFVNLEDIFAEVEQMLQQHDMYVCVSYDTDLAAMDRITGYTKKWMEFVQQCNENKPNLHELTIEIRTKSAFQKMWQELPAQDHVILAYTLSPNRYIQEYEHGTPDLSHRLASIHMAMEYGHKVRLCFDPMLYGKDWKAQYRQLVDEIWDKIDTEHIVDVSIGTFRVSQEYLKTMRKNNPESTVLAFPFSNDHGVYHYPEELPHEMIQYMKKQVMERFREDQIFIWEP